MTELTTDTLTHLTLSFDKEAYPFDKVIADLIGVDDLTSLSHRDKTFTPAGTALPAGSLYKNMEQSPHFRDLYRALDGSQGEVFYDLYGRFVRNVIYPLFNEPILYQRRPSHRILFRDNPGVSRYHRDRDYGHNTLEINFQVVQTPTFGTNAMWIESDEGRDDYQPAELEPGQLFCFNSANLSHGALANQTGCSRVSFDFRVLRVRDAEAGLASRLPEPGPGKPISTNARNFSWFSTEPG